MPRIERALLPLLALVAVLGGAGCFRRTFVVVPQRAGGYTARDTLYAQRDGRDVRVLFRHDTTWRVDTVTLRVTDTLWRGGTRIIRDTIRVAAPLPVPAPTPPATGSAPRVPQAPRRDTVFVPRPGSGTVSRVDTVRVTVRDTVRLTVRDTVWRTIRDTVRVAGGRDTVFIPRPAAGRVDTLRITVRDTVFVGGGRRLMFVPPGQFPPPGQCRLWIADRAPGQQARSVPCDQLGPIPAGAFVLFDDVAWDMDHDWVAESRRANVPPEIVALKRRGAP